MAPSSLSGWHPHAHFSWSKWHGGTFVGTGTHDGVCHAPTSSVLQDRHQHPTTILPLMEIFCVLASLFTAVTVLLS